MSPSFPNMNTPNSWCSCWASAWDLRRASKTLLSFSLDLCMDSCCNFIMLSIASSMSLPLSLFFFFFWSFPLCCPVFPVFSATSLLPSAVVAGRFSGFLPVLISSQQNIVGIRIYFVWWNHKFVYVFIVFWTFSIPFLCDCCCHIHFCIYPRAPFPFVFPALITFCGLESIVLLLSGGN